MSKAEFPLAVAAVDMGSNALRFVAAEFTGPDEFRVLDSERVPVRLGEFAFRKGRLKKSLMKEAVRALSGFRERMEALGIREHRAVATSAIRESRNGEKLTARILRKAGIRVEAIGGAEEGRLVWRAIRNRLHLAGKSWLLADIGGGSVEVSFADAEELVWTESLPLGTVRLLEVFGPDPDESSATLRSFVEQHTAALPLPERGTGGVAGIIATGGNADALADVAGVRPDTGGVRRISLEQLREIIRRLAGLSYRERIEQLNLREDRADVILPAALVYERLATLWDTEMLVIPGVGLKEGVLLDLVDDLVSEGSYAARHAREVEDGAIALGRQYSYDEAHARHVSQLALQLFDALPMLHDWRAEERRVLLAAGILHDVGKVVSPRKHHKHSRYLIRYAELPGLSRHQVQLVSLVARYHRRAKPKRSHAAYGKLEPVDRKRVKELTALLRVADGLDNSHDQRVRILSVADEGTEITLQLTGATSSLLDGRTMKRRCRLFERVFKRQLRLVAEGDAAELSS